MANILITGGAGFIGSSLADELIKNNKIVILDNFNDYYSTELKRQNVSHNLNKVNYKLYEGDILNSTLLESILLDNNISVVVHLAARAGVRPSIEQPELYHKVNVVGTKKVLEACKKCSIEKFIFASSSSVYGALSKGPFSEDMDTSKTISPYARTKVEGEKLCQEYSKYMKIIALRFFTVYGPRQRPDLAISKFINLISQNKPIPVYGDGDTKRNYTYISDIINGIILAMSTKLPNYDVFNLGGDETVELSELIRLIETSISKKALIDRQPMQDGDVPLTHADITKSRIYLGYEPKVSMSLGLDRFIAWFNSCI